jgi:hypothetical protein
MSEKSPVSTEHVLVPRSPLPGEDPSTRKIEVWHIKGRNPDGTIRADSQEGEVEVQVIDPDKKLRRGESNELETLVPSNDLPKSITSPEGQEALARELAGKPLRGDTIVANVGGKFTELTLGDYADTEKGAPRVVETLDAEGNTHHQEEGVILPENQAYMRQLKEQQDRRGVETDLVSPEELTPEEIKEVGEATLDAAEVEEPIDMSRTESAAALQGIVDRVEAKPPAWSKEAREAERAATGPTREHPRMFDLDEGLVRPIFYYTSDGGQHPGVLAGMFIENGTSFAVIKPENAEHGEYLMPEMSWIIERSLQSRQEVPENRAPALEAESSAPEMSDKEYLEKMVEGLAPDDEHHLQMYAMAEADKIAAQKSGDGDGSRDAQESMGWHLKRMSDAAKEINPRYSNRYRKTNNL